MARAQTTKTTKPRQKQSLKKPAPPAEAIGIDLRMWGSAVAKMSLRESGELIRSIVRAQRAKHPNRDQRMLLAVFSREEAPPCKA